MTALQTCLALALAYSLAPFQHVHADADHSTLVHAHFYAHFNEFPVSQTVPVGAQIDHDDDHANVQSLDNFTLAFASTFQPFVLERGPVDPSVDSSSCSPVEVVDECANDPPRAGRSQPRAPPA